MGQAMVKNCPVCAKPMAEKFHPFCSSRCADIDLGRWLGEKYSIPAEPAGDEAGDDEGAA